MSYAKMLLWILHPYMIQKAQAVWQHAIDKKELHDIIKKVEAAK